MDYTACSVNTVNRSIRWELVRIFIEHTKNYKL